MAIMRYMIVPAVLILVLLLVCSYGEAQSPTWTVTASYYPFEKVNLTGHIGHYGVWKSYVVDQYGTGIGNVPVTLHVMSMGANNTYYEVYNVTRITNNTSSFTGLFDFTDITINISGVVGPRAYVDAVFVANNRTFYGRSNDHSFGHIGVEVESVIINTNSPTPTPLTTITPSTTPVTGSSMVLELFSGLSAILLAAYGAYYRSKK